MRDAETEDETSEPTPAANVSEGASHEAAIASTLQELQLDRPRSSSSRPEKSRKGSSSEDSDGEPQRKKPKLADDSSSPKAPDEETSESDSDSEESEDDDDKHPKGSKKKDEEDDGDGEEGEGEGEGAEKEGKDEENEGSEEEEEEKQDEAGDSLNEHGVTHGLPPSQWKYNSLSPVWWGEAVEGEDLDDVPDRRGKVPTFIKLRSPGSDFVNSALNIIETDTSLWKVQAIASELVDKKKTLARFKSNPDGFWQQVLLLYLNIQDDMDAEDYQYGTLFAATVVCRTRVKYFMKMTGAKGTGPKFVFVEHAPTMTAPKLTQVFKEWANDANGSPVPYKGGRLLKKGDSVVVVDAQKWAKVFKRRVDFNIDDMTAASSSALNTNVASSSKRK